MAFSLSTFFFLLSLARHFYERNIDFIVIVREWAVYGEVNTGRMYKYDYKYLLLFLLIYFFLLLINNNNDTNMNLISGLVSWFLFSVDRRDMHET